MRNLSIIRHKMFYYLLITIKMIDFEMHWICKSKYSPTSKFDAGKTKNPERR